MYHISDVFTYLLFIESVIVFYIILPLWRIHTKRARDNFNTIITRILISSTKLQHMHVYYLIDVKCHMVLNLTARYKRQI